MAVLIASCVCLNLILAVVITIAVGLYTYLKWTYKYWERKGVPTPRITIPLGIVPNPFGSKLISIGRRLEEIYMEFKERGEKHAGIYLLNSPTYMPIDKAYVKNVLIKDFNYFVDRGVYYNEKDDPLSAHLFSLEGAKWKKLRAKLTPAFTTGKMKTMFHTIVECAGQMNEAIDDYCYKTEPIDIKDVLARFTIDVIGSCAFGLTCNSFKQSQSNFREYGRKVLHSTNFCMLKNLLAFSNPGVARKLGIAITSQDAAKFFLNVIKDTVEYREKNDVSRNDFMQLLINLKNAVREGRDESDQETVESKNITFAELAAQAFVFFIAGFDTSSTAMTYCMFELAQDIGIQERLRREIRTVLARHDGELTYESLAEMKYMGQIIDETLRKYPPIMLLFRICAKDYLIPETSVTIEKGTSVLIPILGLHHDPEYFPEPDKFDPERFNPENKGRIEPATYIPFGDGPRSCIGIRFGLMQIKVGLAMLLKNYRFVLNPQTKLPLEFEPFSLVLTPIDNIWLNFERTDEVSEWL